LTVADEVTVAMPLQLTPGMMRAVKDHPFTKCETPEEWHAKLGWLICAWDVLIEARQREATLGVPLPPTPHPLAGDPRHSMRNAGVLEAQPQPSDMDYGNNMDIEVMPLGYSLAMRVMQSELYAKLDAQERAECDDLIRQGLRPNGVMAGDVQTFSTPAEPRK
jgi:hypothetical protein